MEITALGLGDIPHLNDEELLSALDDVTQLANRAVALQAVIFQSLEDRSANEDLSKTLAFRCGYRNNRELMRQATGGSSTSVSRLKKLGQELSPRFSLTGEELPAKHLYVATAMDAGQLCYDSAQHILTTLNKLSHCSITDQEDIERTLVQNATGTDLGAEDPPKTPFHADSIKQMCTLWEAAYDPDGTLPPEHLVERNRSLTFGPQKDGLVPLSGRIVPEAAAALSQMIDTLLTPLNTKVSAAEFSTAGTRSQRSHDAFVHLIQITARSKDLPQQGGSPISVMVTVRAENLERNQGAATLQAHDGTSGNVPLYLANMGLCAGTARFMVQDQKGKIIALGHRGRIFNHHQRVAILARDKGCIMPGCTAKPSWCEIHHIQEHAHGGPTHTDNGAALCWWHHRYLHVNGWTIDNRNGVPVPIPPLELSAFPRLHPPPPKNSGVTPDTGPPRGWSPRRTNKPDDSQAPATGSRQRQLCAVP